MKFNLNVNSRMVELDVDPDLPLLWALREHLKLTDTAYGCAQGLCDACKVRIDGVPVRSCITTLEGATPRAPNAQVSLPHPP